MSMAEAAARKTEFLGSKEKMAALMAGDAAVSAEWKLITQNLWQAPAVWCAIQIFLRGLIEKSPKQ
jgi:hypothetical protein